MKVIHKSQEELELFIAMLRDAQSLHNEVFTLRALRLTVQKTKKRFAREGMGFLTKTLPRLGKLFDRALSGEVPLDSSQAAFTSSPSSQLPLFLGELFRCVFSHDGWLLPTPCVKSIKTIRLVLYSYYKYELSYDPDDEEKVVAKFEETERDLEAVERRLRSGSILDGCLRCRLAWTGLHGRPDAKSTVENQVPPVMAGHLVSDRQEFVGGNSNESRSGAHGGFNLHEFPSAYQKAQGTGDVETSPVRTTTPSQDGEADPLREARGTCESVAIGSDRGNSGESNLNGRAVGNQRIDTNWVRGSEPSAHRCQCANCPSHDGYRFGIPGGRAYSQYVRSSSDVPGLIHRARIRLIELFRAFDVRDIYPRHGPGAVSTREQLWGKYQWTRVSKRITDSYPLDEYFFVNLDHVCDRLQELQALKTDDAPARVCLVPKDSRGPRLISCEPVDFQWIQQGLGRAIVKHVESHPLTKWNVHFTDQQPNQYGALYGSSTGKYATLDLAEASDRVSCELVRLLFPEPILSALMNCRTLGTVLPGGKYLKLQKFAPMGSSLCFPILALTVWAVLDAAVPDAVPVPHRKVEMRESIDDDGRTHLERVVYYQKSETQRGILVYGDDVVVPAEYAERAIEALETVGLLVNRNKSFTKGLFRESCGVDAFAGINVTPLRLRTVWTHHRSPETYESWVAYANSFFDRSFHHSYRLIAKWLHHVYGRIPECSQLLHYKDRDHQRWWDRTLHEFCPALRDVPPEHRPNVLRTHPLHQKREMLCRIVRPRAVKKEIDGWSMLLRYFVETGNQQSPSSPGVAAQMQREVDRPLEWERDLFRVRKYTKRRESMLSWGWR